MNILFVCTGNTCRSPMAEAMLKQMDEQLFVQSAGIYAAAGSEANPHTVEVLQSHSIPCDHRSKQVTPSLMEWADIVLTMTISHEAQLVRTYPTYEEKIFTLKEYVQGVSGDITDPFGQAVTVYEQTYLDLHELLETLVSKINE